eukprot:s7836_g1.t1
MTVSWVSRRGNSYGKLPIDVRELNELARESDRFRLKAMATSMKDLVGDPLDEFAKKFTEEFVKLGIRTSMYVRTDIIDGCAVSKLVQLGPGETPPSWGGEDPRDEIQGGQWKGVLGGVVEEQSEVIEIEEEEQVPETPPPSTVVGAFIFVGSFVAKPFSS